MGNEGGNFLEKHVIQWQMVLVEVVESSAGLSAAILCCGEHISVYDTSTYVLERLAGCGFLLVSAPGALESS